MTKYYIVNREFKPMVNPKNIDEKSINEYIQFLADTALMSRTKNIIPRNSFRSEFLEKVKTVITVDNSKSDQYTDKPKKIEYERYE